MPYSLPEYRGEYKMEGRLGESGSGPVYRARDDAGGRPVAIKVLTDPLANPNDPELPDRLQGETNLRHKNILAILALFRNKERICIVTELLEGRNLRELMTEDQSLSLLDRIEIMIQAGEAISYAHAHGIAHRGLKPSRIHVQPDGTVKVRNFGVDLPPADGCGALYTAPEQLSGQATDALCNIFTFGVILNELTANSPEHPSLLTSIVQRATNHDRESRYQSFNELLADAARLLLQLRGTDLHFTGLFESVPAPHSDGSPPHDNVQFTVYRPRAIHPGEWKTLLAFAHLTERRADATGDDSDPMPDLQQANQMDVAQYPDPPRDSTLPIPHEGEMTFVPQMNGVEFNPRRVSLLWQETVHQAAFRLRASPLLDGQTVRGQMCVYLGSIIMAQVLFEIEVNSQRIFQTGEETLAPVTAARYRRVFACYSHQDLAVVEEFERYARAVGDAYLRDVIHLRVGEAWNDRLRQMIDQAEVFQLFWSSHSIRSPYVRQEWQYALTLKRNCFVRPVYWEDPLPEFRELNLPPEELRSLDFHRVVPAMVAKGLSARLEAAAREVPSATTAPTHQVPVYTPSPAPLPLWEAPHAPPPQTTQSVRKPFWLPWAAGVLVLVGVGGLGWYGLRSWSARNHAKNIPPAVQLDPVDRDSPAVRPELLVSPAPVAPEPDNPPPIAPPAPRPSPPFSATAAQPIPPPEQSPVTAPEPRYSLTLWSRGTPILPGQVIRGDDPFLQSSFTPAGTVPVDSSLQVEWYLNGVSSGVTDFDPAEKGKHKSYMTTPRDGNYRAVLLVNREAVASLSFSYRK